MNATEATQTAHRQADARAEDFALVRVGDRYDCRPAVNAGLYFEGEELIGLIRPHQRQVFPPVRMGSSPTTLPVTAYCR